MSAHRIIYSATERCPNSTSETILRQLAADGLVRGRPCRFPVRPGAQGPPAWWMRSGPNSPKPLRRAARPASRHVGFRDFPWCTLESWSRYRRVIGKAEWTGGEANPRFVVTSLELAEVGARYLYEAVY